MPARACGTIRMPRATVNSTTTATTMSTINEAKGVLSSFVYQRGRAVDSEHLYARAGLERVVLVVGTGAPHLTGQPYGPAVAVHAVDHDRAGTDQRGRPGAKLGRHVQ